jgi:site-specific recombinase XerD
MRLANLIEGYIAFKQATGMRFESQARILKLFSRRLGPVDISQVNATIVLAFLNRLKTITSSWHQTYSTLKGFYRYAIARQYLKTAPLPLVVPKGPKYAPPYIYSQNEIKALLDSSWALDDNCHRRGAFSVKTFQTLLLLLYGTGLRISEALSLTMADINLPDNLLIVRNSKFFKSRLVPIGPKLTAVLQDYLNTRRETYGQPQTDSILFLNYQGAPLRRLAAERYFRLVRQQAGIRRTDGAHYQPRLHDLRSTFAVHRLVTWYQQGADVQKLLPQLSTYLGHVHIANTQVYLTMTPELLREANRRFEGYALSEVNHAG